MFTARLLRSRWTTATVCCLAFPAGLALGGCGADNIDNGHMEIIPDFARANVQYSHAVGDWSGLPDHVQCLVGMQKFYPARFNANVPIAPGSWNGGCAPYGACHIWRDAQPNPAVWERIPAGGGAMPSTYDMIVYPPIRGDAYGHIAAVDHVEGNTIYVMDDNYSNDERRSTSPHTVGWPPDGWYHLRSVPKGGTGGGGPCGGLQDGYYCGNDRIGMDGSTLYLCHGGGITGQQHCDNGCDTKPAGQNDACRPGGGTGANCAGQVDGYYCGSDKVGGDPNTLYLCRSGSVASQQACGGGCATKPAGQNDVCQSGGGGGGANCAGQVDGYYCGSDGVSGDPNTLYLCRGGSVASQQACGGGCVTKPAGQNDVCQSGGGGGGANCAGQVDGYYCGSDGVSGDPNTLYLCRGGSVASQQACGGGCVTKPAGQNDVCG